LPAFRELMPRFQALSVSCISCSCRSNKILLKGIVMI
jgi:hypothetical protein